MANRQGGLVYQEYSHIAPSVRYVSVFGTTPGVAVAVPGAEENDILLGVVRLDSLSTDLDLLEDSVFANGEITIETIDATDQLLLIVYFDANAVLE